MNIDILIKLIDYHKFKLFSYYSFEIKATNKPETSYQYYEPASCDSIQTNDCFDISIVLVCDQSNKRFYFLILDPNGLKI